MKKIGYAVNSSNNANYNTTNYTRYEKGTMVPK